MIAAIKRYDTARVLTATIRVGGVPVNISGASVVWVWRRNQGVIHRDSAVIIDPVAGTIRHPNQTEIVAETGAVENEFEVTFANGRVLSSPSIDYVPLQVYPDLG